MNGINYVVDTNCFIYLLDANPILLPFSDEGWAYSYITEIELLSKKGLNHAEDKLIRSMLATCYKVNHSQLLTDITIQLKRKNNIKLPDAVIAATSMVLNLPLVSADKGFSSIDGLNFILLDMQQ